MLDNIKVKILFLLNNTRESEKKSTAWEDIWIHITASNNLGYIKMSYKPQEKN